MFQAGFLIPYRGHRQRRQPFEIQKPCPVAFFEPERLRLENQGRFGQAKQLRKILHPLKIIGRFLRAIPQRFVADVQNAPGQVADSVTPDFHAAVQRTHGFAEFGNVVA